MAYSSGNKYQKTMGVVEEANFRGEMYYAFHEFTGIAIDGTVDIIINTGNKNLFIVGRSFVTTTDKMTLDVYLNPTYTGGTPITISPYNGISPVLPSAATGVHTPTVTATGALFDKFLFLGQPDNNVSRVAGSFRSNEVTRMVPPNTEFLLRFTNKGTVAMDGIAKYLFFERPIDVPLD